MVRGAKVRKLVSIKPEILNRTPKKLILLENYQRKNEGECKNRKKKESVIEDVNAEKNVELRVKNNRAHREAAANERIKSQLMLDA